MIISVISVILVLGVLIFIHELGHHLMARSFGIGVSTFSLGFGPKLWARTMGKTEYCLSLVPLGGYCALVGQDDDEELPEGFTQEENFSRRPPWQRLLVVVAGPAANILLAWVICWGLAFGYGQSHLLATIGGVVADSPAAKAGIMKDDSIVSINNTPINDWSGMASAIAASEGAPIDLVILRNGQEIAMKITPTGAVQKTIFGEEKSSWVIGVQSSGKTAHTKMGFMASAVAGAERTWEMVVLTWTGFVKLFQRVVPLDQVGGPIMIAQMVGQQANEGLSNLLAITALISVNLGILNLLPIPVLDGGHIVFYTLESIIRRPIPLKVRHVTTQAGFFLLIGLMVLATYNDIWRIIQSF